MGRVHRANSAILGRNKGVLGHDTESDAGLEWGIVISLIDTTTAYPGLYCHWLGTTAECVLQLFPPAHSPSLEFITSQNRPKSTRVTRLIQGYETHSFKSNFESWPSGSAPSAPKESRGKVAALLKQQCVGLKRLAKASTTPEEVPPLLEENGKIEVWHINGSAKTPVAKDDIGKFYSGDCYIVLYTYHSNKKKEDYYL
ncbi:hypothetical protein R6Q57_022847 [Mikania cordata]